MRHGSEGGVVYGVDSVLVEDENVDLWTLSERVCRQDGEVIATQLHVAQGLGQAARYGRQTALGHVDVRQCRRRVEVHALEVRQRIAAQHEVQQLT